MCLLMRSLTLCALTSLASAVSLSQFPPFISSLPIPCQVVYRQDILGCSPSDFNNGGCSVGCVKALQAFTPLVNTACGNRNINGQNIIVAFLAGAGPQSICPNANEVLGAGGSSSASSATTTTVPGSSGTSSTTSSTGTPTTGLRTATTGLQSTSAISVAPTSASSASSTILTTQSSSSASRTASPSSSSSESGMEDGSGGGSPFDTPGNLNSAASSLKRSLSMSFLAASAMLLASLR